ncbi:MAG: hypothetical protein ABJZ55_09915 [Fuerstiella sp.]
MKLEELARVVQQAKCQIFGWQDASNGAHRKVLAAVIRTIKEENTTVLCEPSLAKCTTRPPDIVIVCPIRGVAVIEVKGVSLEDISAIAPGGQFEIQYASGARSRNPFAQVRNAMFDIKDGAQRVHHGQFSMRFRYIVALPRIERAEWMARWGENALCPKELIFADDLDKLVPALTRAAHKRLEGVGMASWPAGELKAVHAAFGDSSVLFPEIEEREPRRTRETTLGEMFDESAESYKTLSDEQQTLSAQYWEKGPRVIRGVAGSGKTIVLANNLARRVQRLCGERSLFTDDAKTHPRILVVCFNRTLVPFIQKKIATAYRQRTGGLPPDGVIDVFHLNSLMYHLSEKGFWRYQKVFEKGVSDDARTQKYLADLTYVKENDTATFDAHAYDAIYCDEGQDFHEEEFRLLGQLVRREQTEPSLFVFYDDAQNLYGKKRPNWQSLGLTVLGGRSHIMLECFRNTRQIVEAAFNTLYGSFAKGKAGVPTRAFGDVGTLAHKGLLEDVEGYWKVNFAKRNGLSAEATLVESEAAENALILERLQWLIEQQDVRLEDILILASRRQRIEGLARYLQDSNSNWLPDIHVAFKEKDEIIGQRKRLTLSTVNSAKGYDAYCVLLISANEFKSDIDSRATFYVGCTRAIEFLEVMGYRLTDLFSEFSDAVSRAGKQT